MGELILPGAEIDRRGWNGSGAHPARGVFTLTGHSTEGPPGSIEGARTSLHANGAESNVLAEHRAGTRGGRRIIQLVDLNRSAKSLRNTARPGQTNKGGTVQLELVGRAVDPVDATTAEDWFWLGQHVIGPMCRLVGVPLQFPFRTYPYPPTRWNPPQYLGSEYWRILTDRSPERGIVVHGHWTENTHGDTGDWHSTDARLQHRSPAQLILAGAGAGTLPPIIDTKDELDMASIKDVQDAVARAVGNVGKAVAARDNRDGKVWVVSGSGRWHALNWDVLAGLMMMGQVAVVDRNKIPVVDGKRYLAGIPVLATGDDVAKVRDELADLEAAQKADLDQEAHDFLVMVDEVRKAEAAAAGAG